MPTMLNPRSLALAAANPRLLTSPNAAVLLNASTPVFHINNSGINDPAVIVFNAILIAMEGTVTFSCTGGTLSSVVGNTAALRYVDMTAEKATVTATITYRNKVLSSKVEIAKLYDGQNGVVGMNNTVVYAYQRSATPLTSNPGAVQYSFSAAGITNATLANGWQKTIPTGTDPLYVTAASASASGTTDNIAANEWSAPVVLVQNGASGTNGVNSATVTIYQRTATTTAPTLPSATTTYTFTPPGLTGLNNGWTTTLPPTANGKYLWASTATAANTATTDSIPSSEWAAAQMLVQDGTNGTNGVRGNVNVARAVPWSSWSDFEAVAAISGAGYGTPQNRDVVTLYNSSVNYSEQRYYDGANWLALAAYFPGSVLVNGSVLAEKIDARGLSIKDAAGNIILSAGSPLSEQTRTNPNLVESIKAMQQYGWGGWYYDHFDSTSSRDGQHLVAWANTAGGIQSRLMTLLPNSKYTLSFEAHAIDGQTTLSADLWPDDLPESSFTIEPFRKKYTVTWTTGGQSSLSSCRLRIFGQPSRQVFIWNIKLEIGSVATDWRDDVVSGVNVGKYITPGAIGNTQIGGDLLSTNWNWDISPNGTGWRLDRAGNFYCNSIAVRGSISGGMYNGYVWPAYGNSGFYLGPEGLLLGNGNGGVGGYFQVTAGGHIYAPGFKLENSQLTLTNPIIISPRLSTSFTVSMAGINLSNRPNSTPVQFNMAYTTSNGTGPYRQTFTLNVLDNVNMSMISDPSSSTATIKTVGFNTINYAYLTVSVTDANGQTASATAFIQIAFGTGGAQ